LANKLTTISRDEACEEKPLGKNQTNQTTSTVRSKFHENSTATYIEDKQYASFSSMTYQINNFITMDGGRLPFRNHGYGVGLPFIPITMDEGRQAVTLLLSFHLYLLIVKPALFSPIQQQPPCLTYSESRRAQISQRDSMRTQHRLSHWVKVTLHSSDYRTQRCRYHN
jgi:hypothetical protein